MSNDRPPSDRNLLERLLTNDMDPATYDPARMARLAMRPALPKRFWRMVSVTSSAADSHCIALDGKPARTPARAALAFPHPALADAVADEWRAVADVVDPLAMPLTRLANSAIDGVAAQAAAVAADAARYAGSDLLCYRADTPASLAALQASAWDPLLAWAATDLSAPLRAVTGIAFAPQPEAALAAIAAAVDSVPAPFGLAALHALTTLTGSVIIALAIGQGRLTSDQAWAAAHVDEDFQIAQWGQDEEAMARRAARRREFDAAVLMLALA